jgi:thiol-disulfide isomerase/thioredoxin
MRLGFRDAIAICAASLAIGASLSIWQHAAAALPIGTRLREFVGISSWLNSGAISLDSLSGKVVALDFYTSGCGNCRAAIPHVEKLYEKYKNRGFVVVGIHTPEEDYERNIDYIRKTIKELGITYPIAIDDRGRTWAAYQNQWWPNFLLFDRSGKLVLEHPGEGAYEEIDAVVKTLL